MKAVFYSVILQHPALSTFLKYPFFVLALCFQFSFAFSQIEVTNGPDLNTDRDMKFNKIIGGDKDHFYVYRVRSRGFGTDYYFEKYSKSTLKKEFFKVINLPSDVDVSIVDLKYSHNNLYLFLDIYNRKTDQKSLVLQNISPDGDFATDLKEIKTVNAEKSRYASFEIVANTDTTKFLVVTEYKQDKKDNYKLNLLLMDAINIKKLWEKELPAQYSFSPMNVLNYKVDENDNVYFLFRTNGKEYGQRRVIYRTYVGVLRPEATGIQVSELEIAKDYNVSDVEFIKNGNQLVCAGFYKDVIERPGRDLYDVGLFYYTFNFETGELLSKKTELFKNDLLEKLTYKRQQPGNFDYKIDYMKRIGNDVYLVGQQYMEEYVYYYNYNTRSTTSYWMYDYKDILVAKLNSNMEIEWIRNIPFRYAMRMNNPHVFMHYFAYNTDENLYLFYNENQKNFTGPTYDGYEPNKIRYYGSIHGSNFIGTSIDLKTGTLKRQLVFENDDYCFAPIQENNLQFVPDNNTQVFVSDGKDQLIIYTEDRGRERFSKLKLK